MLLQLSHFPSFIPLHPAHSLPPSVPPCSSCPWVIHISTSASTFPILVLTFPFNFVLNIYASYSLYLFPILPPPTPTDNPPYDLHFSVSIPVLVVCLVCFGFLMLCCSYLSVCCQLLFIVFDLLFLR